MTEYVPLAGRTPCPDIERVELHSHAEADDYVARAVARGRIVARLVEADVSTAYRVDACVVEAPDEVLVVFSSALAPSWSPWRVASVADGIAAARAILASGTAYNY